MFQDYERGRLRNPAIFQMAFDWRLLHISKHVCLDLVLFSDVLFEVVSSLIFIQMNCIKCLTMKGSTGGREDICPEQTVLD